MRILTVLVVALILPAPQAHAQSATLVPTATITTSGVPGQLVRTYQRMLDGIVAVDTVTLSRILSVKYTWTPSGDTTTYTRSQRFAMMARSKDRLDSLYVRHCRIALYSAAAVGNCRVAQRGSFDQAGTGHSEVLSTVTFVKEGQGWTIASTHTLVTQLPSQDAVHER